MSESAAPKRELITHVDEAVASARLSELRTLLDAAAARAGRAQGPEILVASKYFHASAIPGLIAAGATRLGENRADVIEDKQQAATGSGVRWDFIGELQSRKAATIAPLVSRIHTLASPSAVRKLAAFSATGGVVPELLVQVNVAGEVGKGGVDPDALSELLEAAADLPVRGLMTMPPLAGDPADSRRWFASLREIAGRHGLTQLSMGTSQDAVVAAEEGATVVRIGGLLTSDNAWQRLTDAHA